AAVVAGDVEPAEDVAATLASDLAGPQAELDARPGDGRLAVDLDDVPGGVVERQAIVDREDEDRLSALIRQLQASILDDLVAGSLPQRVEVLGLQLHAAVAGHIGLDDLGDREGSVRLARISAAVVVAA